MASKFLENLNKGFSQSKQVTVVSQQKEQTKKKSAKENIQNLIDSKAIISIYIDTTDTEGNLICHNTEDGLIYKIPYETLYSTQGSYTMVGREINVTITSFKDDVVNCEMVSKATFDMQGRIISDLCKELKADNHPRLWGKVLYVTASKANIDLLGKGVRGILKVKEYSKGYTRDLTKHLHPGDMVECDVVGLAPRIKGHHHQGFYVSRRDIAKDPWNEIDESIKKGSIVAVRCIDLPMGKSYWWGLCSGISEEIEIMADFSQKVRISEGGIYRCVITDFDTEKHILKVAPFAPIKQLKKEVETNE